MQRGKAIVFMAKKKKKKGTGQTAPLSPERYIREKARLLPVDRCLVNADWKDAGLADVIVIRRHTNGHFTLGAFLVDTFCRGVYDSFYKFNIDEEELEDMLDRIADHGQEMIEVGYAEAHNIVFGAIEFADEAGIKPCKEFALTQYLLEEDTDDVPLIEYDFGKEGKHWLFAHSNLEASRYLPAMKKALGNNYEVTIVDDDDDDDMEEDYDDHFPDEGPDGEYSYEHPEYPSQIELKHPWVQDLLTTPEKEILTKDEIDRLLALPHDELRHDLEQMALYEMGRNANGEYSEPYNPVISHVLLLLGEVGDEGSLDVALEVMRQDDEFRDYHICDGSEYIIIPPLYQLAKHNLRRLLDYLKEPGLYTYFRGDAIEAMLTVAERSEPERRTEIIGYAREFISFLIAHRDDPKSMDGTVAGLLCSELVDLGATELLPDIEALFATGRVVTGVCGTLSCIRRDIRRPRYKESPEPYDVYKLYEEMDKAFGNK